MTSDVITTPSWERRITGRWALSWQTYALGVLVNVPLLVVTGGRIGTRIVPVEDMGVLFLYGMAASLVAGAWALLMNATVFRQRRVRPVALWQFAMLHLVSGAIFGCTLVLADARLGIDLGVPPALTIVVTMGIGLWWGATTALLLEGHERFVRDRAALLDDAVLGQLALMQDSRADVMLAERPWSSVVATRLADARGRIESQLTEATSIATWLGAAQALRETADETVRPLSHALWQEAAQRYPEPRVSGVLTLLLREPTFLPLAAASVNVIGYLGASAQEYGAFLGPVIALAFGGISFAVLTAGNVLMARVPRLRHVIYLACIVILVAVALMITYGPARTVDEVLPPSLLAGSVLGVLIAVVLTSIVASLDASRAHVIGELRSVLNQERIAQAARGRARVVAMREAAKDLHGTVQTRLIACASAVEMAAAAGDLVAYESAMRQALGILEGERPPLPTSVGARLALLASSWRGICDVSLDIEPVVADSASDDVVRVIEEAVGNAHRHGGAEHVWVQAQRVDDRIHVSVRDDGRGPAGGRAGLGTDLLARATDGRFALRAGPTGGAELTAVLPAPG